MRILHVLDHSAPILSGYTYRTLSILREQCRLGWETTHVTSSKHPAETPVEESEGFRFYRTAAPRGVRAKLPVIRQLAVVRELAARLRSLMPELAARHPPRPLPISRTVSRPFAWVESWVFRSSTRCGRSGRTRPSITGRAGREGRAIASPGPSKRTFSNAWMPWRLSAKE